jgi:hypothetical protein
MKKHDFTQTGGFPLDQDQLKHLQDGAIEWLFGLTRMGGASKVLLWGCAVSRVNTSGSVWDYTIGAGGVFFENEYRRVPGMTLVGVDVGVDAVYLELVNDNTTLTYYDSGTHASQLDNYMRLAKYTIGTADSVTKFALDNLVRFGVGFGADYRESGWSTIVVATGAGNGTITGNIYYKKDLMANTLRVRGVLAVGTPADFTASPVLTQIAVAASGSLASGYRPVVNRFFSAATFDGSVGPINRFMNDAGDSYIDRVTMSINSNGSISGYFIKPDAGVAGYLVNFYDIIPID